MNQRYSKSGSRKSGGVVNKRKSCGSLDKKPTRALVKHKKCRLPQCTPKDWPEPSKFFLQIFVNSKIFFKAKTTSTLMTHQPIWLRISRESFGKFGIVGHCLSFFYRRCMSARVRRIIKDRQPKKVWPVYSLKNKNSFFEIFQFNSFNVIVRCSFAFTKGSVLLPATKTPPQQRVSSSRFKIRQLVPLSFTLAHNSKHIP